MINMIRLYYREDILITDTSPINLLSEKFSAQYLYIEIFKILSIPTNLTTLE